MPVYLVRHGDDERLVDAPTSQGARTHVAKGVIKVERASQVDLFRLAKTDVEIETANADPEPSPASDTPPNDDPPETGKGAK